MILGKGDVIEYTLTPLPLCFPPFQISARPARNWRPWLTASLLNPLVYYPTPTFPESPLHLIVNLPTHHLSMYASVSGFSTDHSAFLIFHKVWLSIPSLDFRYVLLRFFSSAFIIIHIHCCCCCSPQRHQIWFRCLRWNWDEETHEESWAWMTAARVLSYIAYTALIDNNSEIKVHLVRHILLIDLCNRRISRYLADIFSFFSFCLFACPYIII